MQPSEDVELSEGFENAHYNPKDKSEMEQQGVENTTIPIEGSEKKPPYYRELMSGTTLKCFLAEAVGTFFLVLLGCMTCMSGGWGEPTSLLQVGVGFGMVVMIIVQVIGHVSGAHVNPAITLAALICGSMKIPMAVIYFVAQLIGGICGYGVLLLLTPEFALGDSGAFCVTMPSKQVTAAQAVVVEMIVTMILILVTCSIWDPCNARNTDSVPLKFGFVIAAMVIAGGPYTGASMNPVRSLAPAIWNNKWHSHWVYWVGPLLGSAIAALLYRFVFKKDLPEAQPEDIPLNENNKTRGQA